MCVFYDLFCLLVFLFVRLAIIKSIFHAVFCKFSALRSLLYRILLWITSLVDDRPLLTSGRLYDPFACLLSSSVYAATTRSLRKSGDGSADGIGGLYMQDSEPIKYNPAVE